MNIQTETEMEIAQILYCERYGIIESTRAGKIMIYYASYPSKNDPFTYKVVVDLEKSIEIDRVKLKYYYKKGENNMYL